MTARFPTRTVVLMALTLIAFGWYWWQMRVLRSATPGAPEAIRVTLPAAPDSGAWSL